MQGKRQFVGCTGARGAGSRKEVAEGAQGWAGGDGVEGTKKGWGGQGAWTGQYEAKADVKGVMVVLHVRFDCHLCMACSGQMDLGSIQTFLYQAHLVLQDEIEYCREDGTGL